MPFSSKTWLGTAALGTLAMVSSLAAPSAARADLPSICPTAASPVAISQLVDCVVPATQLTFFNFQEFDEISTGTAYFSVSGLTTNFNLIVNYDGNISFNYQVAGAGIMPTFTIGDPQSIASIAQTVQGTYLTEGISFNPDSFPTLGPVTVTSSIQGVPGTVTGITHGVTQTPGPLPILGAGAAFGFSRKLRRRINQVA